MKQHVVLGQRDLQVSTVPSAFFPGSWPSHVLCVDATSSLCCLDHSIETKVACEGFAELMRLRCVYLISLFGNKGTGRVTCVAQDGILSSFFGSFSSVGEELGRKRIIGVCSGRVCVEDAATEREREVERESESERRGRKRNKACLPRYLRFRI